MEQTPETKLCKHCQSPIPYAAKVCPVCRRKVKGGNFLKILLIAVAAVVVIAVIAGAGGKKTEEPQKIGEVQTFQPTEPTQPATEPAPTEPPKTEYRVGDILQDGDMKIVYVASGVFKSDNQFSQPAEGNQYIFLKFAFENISDKTDHNVSFYSFSCYADGYAADAYYGGDEGLSATLSAGRATMGCIYFEVPKEAGQIDVEYEANLFTNKKLHFIYEGEQDSGYQLPVNTAAAEGALSVGDTVTSQKLNITYLSCQRYESDNMFIQPKDGFHYISCELEFENVGTSDESVSALSFDCYADGAACEQTYIRDDNLSATLSAGRKCRGTVTFEVPDDAVTVEVEYLSNYWTSNRVVFTVSE